MRCCPACWRPRTSFAALAPAAPHDELADYEQAWRVLARSAAISGACATSSRSGPSFGTVVGVALGGLDMWMNDLFGRSLFGTLKHGKPDYATPEAGSECQPIVYPKPDGVLTFDRLSSVFLSNTNHEEDQPVHLRVEDMALQKRRNTTSMAGLRSATARQAFTNGSRTARRAALCDQRAELRSLQNLRHQGPEPEHHLGDRPRAAAGRTTSICSECAAERPWRYTVPPRRYHESSTARVLPLAPLAGKRHSPALFGAHLVLQRCRPLAGMLRSLEPLLVRTFILPLARKGLSVLALSIVALRSPVPAQAASTEPSETIRPALEPRGEFLSAYIAGASHDTAAAGDLLPRSHPGGSAQSGASRACLSSRSWATARWRKPFGPPNGWCYRALATTLRSSLWGCAPSRSAATRPPAPAHRRQRTARRPDRDAPDRLGLCGHRRRRRSCDRRPAQERARLQRGFSNITRR